MKIHDAHLMFVGCHEREYDGGLKFVHISVLGTILGTAREGLAGTTDVADRCRFEDRDAGDNGCHGLALALRRKKKNQKNQLSAKYAEGVVFCLIASTMRTRAILLVLINTEMVSITITTINRCIWSIGRERL
jgi:hypothetical protein